MDSTVGGWAGENRPTIESDGTDSAKTCVSIIFGSQGSRAKKACESPAAAYAEFGGSSGLILE